jgi:DNA adenine methylase
MNLLWDKATISNGQATKRITNVATVPKLSPFRYPGGKTWLVPQIREWLETLGYKPSIFIEPFAGGGIASLIAVMENRAETAVLCELDYQVYAVWETILNDTEWIVTKIKSFRMNTENVRQLLDMQFSDLREIAFQTLVRNRAQRGGILAPGASLMKKGENGRGVASRWYPETLAKRIQTISEHKDRFKVVHGDGILIINEYISNKEVVFFVDPPYTAGGKQAGKRLYLHNQIDHQVLFRQMSKVEGKFLMTYSDTAEVRYLANKWGFSSVRVPMKNTHHDKIWELLITN